MMEEQELLKCNEGKYNEREVLNRQMMMTHYEMRMRNRSKLIPLCMDNKEKT